MDMLEKLNQLLQQVKDTKPKDDHEKNNVVTMLTFAIKKGNLNYRIRTIDISEKYLESFQ
jgi:hypothetical protein